MANEAQLDFTSGSIPRHLIRFSPPMFAGYLLQALYTVVNSIWVGQFLGVRALGAVTITMPIIMALLSLVMGLTMAATTLVAQYRGAGDEAMVRRTTATSLTLLFFVGMAFSVGGVIFRYALVGLVHPPEQLLAMSVSYFSIFMGGLICMFLYNTLAAILRGLGDARTPLNFLVLTTLVNAVLDPLLIIGVGPFPHLGVAGAAWATVFSQALASVLLWRWMARRTALLPARLSLWRMEPGLVRLILRIGLPSGIQQGLISFGMVVVASVVSSFGPDVVAAYGAASRLDQFGFLPAQSIAMAVASMVGQNLGAGRFDRAVSSVRWSLSISSVLTALIAAVAILKPTIVLVLFTSDPGVLAEGGRYLQTLGWAYVPFSVVIILGGVLRGAGDTLPPMFFTIIALWAVRVPLSWYLARLMGSSGIWLGIALSSGMGMLLHAGYYLTGRWKRRIAGGDGGVAHQMAAAGR